MNAISPLIVRHFSAKKGLVVGLLFMGVVSLYGGGKPEVLSLEQALKGMPSEFHIILGGRLAFYRNKLYADSGSGLLEVSNGVINNVYQWERKNPSIDDVCHDIANGMLWVRTDAMKLACYDGKTWRNVKFPKSKYPKLHHGHFLRGDRIYAIRLVSGRESLWLAGAGRAWFWQGSGTGKWTEEALPPDFFPEWYFGPLVRKMIPADGVNFAVRRGVTNADREMDSTGWYPLWVGAPDGDSVWSFANGKWNTITNKAGYFVTKQTANVNNTGYIQTIAGTLLQVTASEVAIVQTPGKCEAIVCSSTGTLLASVRGLGVFELRKEWHQLLKAPYSDDGGKFDIGLAEQDGQIALVFCPRPQTDSFSGAYIEGANGKCIYKSCHSLWVSQGRGWKQVPSGLGK